MEIPRRCSSGRRSVSFPVSARTSHVLPWSMCPAVPIVSGISEALDEKQARIVLPQLVELLERNEPTRLVERARPRIPLVGIRRPERLDLQILDFASSKMLLRSCEQCRAETLTVAGSAHSHHVDLRGPWRVELQGQ